METQSATPLSTETVITADELIKLNMAILSKNRYHKIINIVIFAYVGICVVTFLLNPNKQSLISTLPYFLLLLIPLWSRWTVKKQVKTHYMNNKAIQNQHIIYEFYENHLQSQTSTGTGKVEYRNLYKIYETKEHFYLMESNCYGHILVKKNCSPALLSFLTQLKTRINKK